MFLVSADIQMFRNFTEAQRIEIETGVTGLVGKNESGKTTILKALHRLNPANPGGTRFDLTTEYPRWRLSSDRRKNPQLGQSSPIEAEFGLEEKDFSRFADDLGISLPREAKCRASKSYEDETDVWLTCEWTGCLEQALNESSLADEERETVSHSDSFDDAMARARGLAKEFREKKNTGKSKAVRSFISELEKLEFLLFPEKASEEVRELLNDLLPRFFYFSSYQNLPGECNLTVLAKKVRERGRLSLEEQTVISLLSRAEVSPKDFLDEDYESREAELQAVGSELSAEVFKYWKQNQDLEVVFNTDNVPIRDAKGDIASTERILKIELSDARHGGVKTNFSTRSSGFQWFFSFFAAFSEYQETDDSIVVLLDEPGTSLHGEAQKDFLEFIYDELGASSQTLYTTHSQFMVDPAKYENLRAVHDTASKDNREGGVVVSNVSLSADRDTILPIESSLGYSISQHLFIGSGHHLAVEGSSDFVYLQRMSEYLVAHGRTGLNPRLSILRVGGADNLPAFVALLGRRLKVSALIDGSTTVRTTDRVKTAAAANGVKESAIVVCSQAVPGLAKTADIEDLFADEDYLRLYAWAFPDRPAPTLAESSEPMLRRVEIAVGEKFNHALPAHALTDWRNEFFDSVQPASIERFEKLIVALNHTVD